MDGMDNNGDMGAARGEPAEETRFATMRVDDIGGASTQMSGKRSSSLDIKPRLGSVEPERESR